ncbi:MAG: hypothetical protein UU51_C0021G0009 [Microgenomates group bacterium GW2011_GWC1_41_20]|uniref:Uncharacterized protein n=4 Tax=Candidatus Woeseibacteriota TaxID=1752722 RepID=A0A1F8DH55_9BACT|nr:MAG: hypothetical protein UU39_C0021G0008 [Candidatus Woesebacteria bacterium GW2011_GWD1_41_12]KKS00069.1 MAG: hypothetical protein UU51_C0021G0009 [Microgenomates group bacterium GW2011_GWC1_41_20]KKS05138.1 MAG: hypothetical protein UU57_C0015G0019 [Candidatus Woesebacteria bacterium GW2011_GWE1_41_24]OGM84660.1 MAG: hypothetical protein A2434_01150 [Candidatus Woesebacteria bacterium RIFOXYC1_FULL_41_14]OGM87359.1 MAG: hypothetical protein A2594_01925 [Candidatus Woesebacteria bacterium 
MDTQKKVSPVVKAVIIVVGLVVIAVIGLVMSNAPVFANSECLAPNENYQLVENRMASDLAGNPVYIVRGILVSGEGSVGGKKVVIPACGSRDEGIEEVNNVNLVLDGRQVFLISGSVGRDLSSNPTLEPQP